MIKAMCVKMGILLLVSTVAVAESIVFNVSGGTQSVNVPEDLVSVVKANKSAIEAALQRNGVNGSTLSSVMTSVNNEYNELINENGLGTTTPYTTSVNGLNDFSDDLCDTIPDTQTLQNVWAESWIGMLIPNVKLGFGINAGAAALDIKSLKRTARALSIDVEDLEDNLAFPTVTADVRLGGVVLPFDVGFAFSTIDSTKIDPLDDAISPCEFDYFSIGGDIRYRIINAGGKFFHTRVSIGGGGYYTKGSVGISDDDSKSQASMDFSSTTLFMAAQASAKVLCLVPFVGGRLMTAKSKVDWDIDADWSNILDSSGADAGNINNAASWGILPSHFEGNASSDWNIRQQVFGGVGIDLFVIDITASASYDFKTKIPGAAVSARFSI